MVQHPMDVLDQAVDAALAALSAAACAGAVSVGSSEHWMVAVREGRAEQVDAGTNRGIRITAWAAGNRSATVTSADLDPAAVAGAATRAAELAAACDADPWGGLAPIERCGQALVELDLDDASSFATFSVQDGIQRLIAAERAARAADPRIATIHRSRCSARRGTGLFATTHGIRQRETATRFGLSVSAVADSAGEKHLGWDATAARHLQDLRTPDQVGSEAGRRAVEGYGWRSPPTGRWPVVFRRETASELLDTVTSAVWGAAVFRGQSFLADAVGTQIAAPAVTIIDDPLLRRGLGSRDSDGEGVRAAPLLVVADGVLRSFLVDGEAARRLRHPYTGHAGGTSNVRLLPGADSLDELLKKLGTGLLATRFHGHGVDLAAGTLSKGVDGFWVESGRIAYPVQAATLAGDLREILHGIRAIGDDPETETTCSSPSLLIDGCTVAGDAGAKNR